MCGLAAASSRRLQHTSSLQHSPEQQLAAFLTLMGLSALPGQQQLTTPQPAAGAAAAVGSHGLPGATGGQSGDSKAAGGKQTARKHSSTSKQADPLQGSLHVARVWGAMGMPAYGLPTSRCATASHSPHSRGCMVGRLVYVAPQQQQSQWSGVLIGYVVMDDMNSRAGMHPAGCTQQLLFASKPAQYLSMLLLPQLISFASSWPLTPTLSGGHCSLTLQLRARHTTTSAHSTTCQSCCRSVSGQEGDWGVGVGGGGEEGGGGGDPGLFPLQWSTTTITTTGTWLQRICRMHGCCVAALGCVAHTAGTHWEAPYCCSHPCSTGPHAWCCSCRCQSLQPLDSCRHCRAWFYRILAHSCGSQHGAPLSLWYKNTPGVRPGVCARGRNNMMDRCTPVSARSLHQWSL